MTATNNCKHINEAVISLKNGGIIAYPTESVFGLGCDPFNHSAITKLLMLKKRPLNKGFILIASSWEQILPLIQPLPAIQHTRIKSTWPGPVTWVFPASEKVPQWITGEHKSVALRLTKHPIASAICDKFAAPIISTSANPNGVTPAKDLNMVQQMFPRGITYYVPGATGNLAKPTPILNAMTGDNIRN